MTWHEITPRHGGRRPQTIIVVRVDDKHRMVMYLGAALVKRIGWDKVPRAQVQRGDGPDAGRIRLAPLPDGDKRGYTLSVSSGKRGIENGPSGRSLAVVWDGFSDKAIGSANARFRIGEMAELPSCGCVASYIEIDLPRGWLLATTEAAA